MSSPTHQANILNPSYQEIGISVAVGKIDGRVTTLVVQHFGKSYTSPMSEQFAKGTTATTPEVAGATEVSGGESIEVSFKETKHSLGTTILYYSQKIFLILLIFILVNLFLTIFIRLKIQHKPIILHCLIVVGLGLLAVFYHFHFLESVATGVLRIV
jgi:hypothetical protein